MTECKPSNPPRHAYASQLEHLTTLARSPLREWQLYAWRRAKELERDASGLWLGLPADLQRAIGPGPSSESESPRQRKHP